MIQSACESRCDRATSIGKLHPCPCSIGASRPPCIDQPDFGLVSSQLLAQQRAIDTGMQRHEGGAKARTESRRGLGDAFLGARNLGGVSAQKMVHGLGFGQSADGRQYSESVTCQEDHILRMTGGPSKIDIAQMIEWVASSSVFGQRVVVEVDASSLRITDDVLEDGSESPGCGVDVRFPFWIESDDFGVTTPLHIEHAIVGPAVLVITDQGATRVGREGRFAGATQAEEERDIIPTDTIVGAAVHRHHTSLGQEVIHYGEDAFLDLSGVLRAADESKTLGNVEKNEGAAVGTVALGVRRHARGVDNGEVWLLSAQLLAVRLADKHVAGKEVLPCVLVDHPHIESILRIRAGVTIKDEKVALSPSGL